MGPIMGVWPVFKHRLKTFTATPSTLKTARGPENVFRRGKERPSPGAKQVDGAALSFHAVIFLFWDFLLRKSETNPNSGSHHD